jgi:hypothetical protein
MKKLLILLTLIIGSTNLFGYIIGNHDYKVTLGMSQTLNGVTSCHPFKWICKLTITDAIGNASITKDDENLYISILNSSIDQSYFDKYLNENQFEFNCENVAPFFQFNDDVCKKVGLVSDFKIMPGLYGLDKTNEGYTTIIIPINQ